MNPTPVPSVSNCYVFKSLLQEYAQKVKLPNPTYNTIKEGPSHEPSFRSTVIVDDVTYDSLPGFFSRRDAEQSAAEVALKALANSGAMGECISQPVHDTGLCKNLLQAYAQKMNFAIPLYICHKDEKPGMTGYVCTVDIGGIKYIGGAARSKKEAELKAARTALLAIQSDPSMSSMKVNASSSSFTVVPGKKKVSDSVIKAQETAAALKPKKRRLKKRQRKRKNKDRGENGQNAKDNVYVNNEGQVAPEAIKTSVIVDETIGTGFPPTGEIHQKLSEFNGGDQSDDKNFSAIQYSGEDLLERPITKFDSHQSAHGGSSLEHASMPTSSALQQSGGDFLERPITALDSHQNAHGGSSLEHTSMPTSSAIQYSGGDFLERPITTLDSHQSAHGSSSFENTSMPTSSSIQYSGGDFLERPITTLDSHQNAHGSSSFEHTSMPTSSGIQHRGGDLLERPITALDSHQCAHEGSGLEHTSVPTS